MGRVASAALGLLALCLASASLAVQPEEMLKDPAQESRARTLSAEIRCLVCQNQSIDDSDASLARDLRMLVRDQIQQGRSDAEIRRFLVGPRQCEITGITWSADRKTVFIGVQHPGEDGGDSHFPDGGNTVARSAVIAITKDDGSRIG